MSAKSPSRGKLLATIICGSILAVGTLATSSKEASAQTSGASDKTCTSTFRANKSRIEAAAKTRGGEAQIKQIMKQDGCGGNGQVSIARPPAGTDPNKIIIDCWFKVEGSHWELGCKWSLA